MIHIGPALVTGVLSDMAGRPAGPPLFAAPVLADPRLARAVSRLHVALTGPATALERGEQLLTAIVTASRYAVTPVPPGAPGSQADLLRTARRVRDYLEGSAAGQVSGAGLAAAAGCSRYAAYRAFRAVHGLAPSEYQRLLRLRAARRSLAAGLTPAAAGFADQAHLTRWFRRCYGITPAAFQRAAG